LRLKLDTNRPICNEEKRKSCSWRTNSDKKIIEVSRQLTSKEEEIIAIKKKFKEERVMLENDKKRMIKELSDY